MLRQCFILNTGLLFHKNVFTSIGIDPNTLYPRVLPHPAPLTYTPSCPTHQFTSPLNFARDKKRTVPCGTGTGDGGKGAVEKVKEEFVSEEMEGLLGSLAPVCDWLRMVEGWWVLEVLLYNQKMDNTWTQSKGYVTTLSFHLSFRLMSITDYYPFLLDYLWVGQDQPGLSAHHPRRWALKSRTVKILMEATGLFKDNGKEWKKYEPAAKLDAFLGALIRTPYPYSPLPLVLVPVVVLLFFPCWLVFAPTALSLKFFHYVISLSPTPHS
jgi:hypothetical protein